MKLLTLLVESIRNIKLATLTFDNKGVHQITGPNGAGKSTLLKCIIWAIEGKRSWPDVDTIISEGEKKGKLELTVGDFDQDGNRIPQYTITVLFRTNPKITVKAADGSQITSQAKLLNTFLNDIAVNPMKYASLDDKDIMVKLKEAMQYTAIPEWVKWTGSEELTDDPIATLDEVEKSKYAERKQANAQVKKLVETLKSYMDVPDGLEPVNMQDLMAERTELQELQNRHDRLADKKESLESEISRLELQLEQARQSLAETSSNLTMTPDVTDNLAQIDRRISNADKANRSAEKGRYRQELSEQERLAEELDEAVKEIREAKLSMIAAAKPPIDGMEIDEENRVMLNGRTIEATGGADRLLAMTALAMALNPEVRAVLVDEGWEIGNSRMDKLKELTDANDFQFIAVREVANNPNVEFAVDLDGKVGRVENDQ